MRIVGLLALALFVPLTLPAPRAAHGEALAPGRYQGWVVQDRWGDVHLSNNAFQLRFEGATKKAALAHLGQCVEADVTKVHSPMDSTQGILAVAGFKKVTPAFGGQLQLEIQQPEVSPPQPHIQRVFVRLRYDGKESFRMDARHLKLVLRRRGARLPGDKTGLGVSFPGKDDHGTPWRHGGSMMRVVEPKTVVHHEHVYLAPGGAFESRGPFIYTTELVLNLPVGAYEVYGTYAYGNFSTAAGPRSNALDYDVLAKR